MNDAIDLLPIGAVTGIGSLPMTDPVDAVEFVASQCPYFPFWPQLPQRADTESVIAQFVDPFTDLLRRRDDGLSYEIAPGRLDEFVRRCDEAPAALPPSRAAGFYAFEEALAQGRFPDAIAVKGQVVGPLTLALALYNRDRAVIHAPEVRAAVARYVARCAHWQIERLSAWDRLILIFLDEPSLGVLQTQPAPLNNEDVITVLRTVMDAIRDAGTLAGIHSCASLPIDLLCNAAPDVLSFDAHQGVEAFFCNDDAIAYMRAGGVVAFGMVPTWSDLSTVTAQQMFMRWLLAAIDVGETRSIARRSLVTSTCGLGLLDADAARDGFEMAHAFSALLHGVAQGKSSADVQNRRRRQPAFNQ